MKLALLEAFSRQLREVPLTSSSCKGSPIPLSAVPLYLGVGVPGVPVLPPGEVHRPGRRPVVLGREHSLGPQLPEQVLVGDQVRNGETSRRFVYSSIGQATQIKHK